MLLRIKLLILSSIIFYYPIHAQIEGDNIFAKTQIITIELDFEQVNFWDSLVLNYETASYMKADLTLSDSTGTYSFEDVGVRLKGNSSYNHPGNKKSFKIDFNEYVKGQNYDGLKKLNFSNAFKDPTLMREKLFFDVCRASNVAAPRANFANVYFNGTLWGFYTVVEQIDDQFLDWRIQEDDGNLFKAGDNFVMGPNGGENEADLKYYGTDQNEYENRYELKSNEDDNDWSDLIDFIDFINNSSSSDFEDNVSEHLELQEYLRSAALDNLFSNLDSYTESARNYYLYHNLDSDKWEWIKWDGNEAFGSYGGGPGASDMTTLAPDFHGNDRPLLENIFESEKLYESYQKELCYLTDNFFNADLMSNRINELKSLIQTSVYADNNKMYSNSQFDNNIETDITTGGGPTGGKVYGLKSFVQKRYDFISNELDCSQLLHAENINSVDILIYPNPFQSHINIDLTQNRMKSFRIFTVLGKEIMYQDLKEKTNYKLDLSSLDKGAYYLVFYPENNDENSYPQMIIKE